MPWWIQIDGASFHGPWEATEEEQTADTTWPGERRGPFPSWHDAMDAGLDAIDHRAGLHQTPLEGCTLCMSELREYYLPDGWGNGET